MYNRFILRFHVINDSGSSTLLCHKVIQCCRNKGRVVIKGPIEELDQIINRL